MATLLDNVENGVWHAFDFLALEGDRTASKGKLKVLTEQIGTVLELENVSKGLDDYRSTTTLTYDQYRYYLFKEVFSGLPDEMPVEEQHMYEAKLDEVFWKQCKAHYIERDNPVMPEDCIYYLFRIFCMLGEMVENDVSVLEVVMAAAEVENVAQRFLTCLGRGDEWDPEEFDSIASVIQAFKFGIVLTVFESKYLKDVDEGGMREALRDVHDFYILDVIKKGFLGKRMELMPVFRDHFFVLQPNLLSLYTTRSQKVNRGEFALDSQCRVEALPDLNTKSPLKKPPGAKSHSRFKVFANEKVYEFQASDHRTRLQWIRSFKTAIEASGSTVRYQRDLAEKRKIARQEEKEREDEEMLRRLSQSDSLDQTKQQLEQEKQARVNAEVQAATLKKQRVLEEKKMKEMEKIREQLEKLLEEERQAKKDEEIVRTLQARILNEEWARRETLEKLQEDQKRMLEEERKKREQFEKIQQEKERELREAKSRVEEMEMERKKLDQQLQVALEKTKAANHGQEVLEAKIKIQEQERDYELDKESNTYKMSTLNPSASFYVKNRDRTSYMPMRSASMRETSYSRSIRRSRQKPSTNTSLLSVSNANTTAGDHLSNSNVAIEEVNSNASGTDE